MKYVIIFSVGLFIGAGLLTVGFHFSQNEEVQQTVSQVKRMLPSGDVQPAAAQGTPVLPEGDVDYNAMVQDLTGSMEGATAHLNEAVKAAESDLQGFAGQLQGLLNTFEKLVGQFEKDAEPVRKNLEELSQSLEGALTPPATVPAQ